MTDAPTVIGSGADDLAPGVVVGPYRIDEQLGAGGMGVVWRARHLVLERPAALKVMKPELTADRQYVDRFLREARAAALVHHQHVVAIHDAGDLRGRPWLACEFVPGGDLNQLLTRQGPLRPEQALRLIAACADGLQALHEAGLVHRDIKPHNIFLDAHGHAKLGDFGLARGADGGDRLTVTGVGLGTPAYMAPEQAAGVADLDIRADIHALGGTLFALVTGKPPFAGATAWAVVNAVMNDPPPDPTPLRPDLPPEVAALIARAMAKRRDDRFQTPAELAAACRAARARILGEVVVQPGLATAPSLLGPLAHGGWWWPAGALVALLALPLASEPLAGLHPGWQALTYDSPGLWGRALAWAAIALLFLLTPLRVHRGEHPARAAALLPLLLGAGAAALATACALRAVVDAADLGVRWLPGVHLVAAAAGVGWLIAYGRAWWAGAPQPLTPPLTRLVQVVAVALAIAGIAHLLGADAARHDANGGLANRLFGRHSDQPMAAAAVVTLAHLLVAVIPALIRVRRPRG